MRSHIKTGQLWFGRRNLSRTFDNTEYEVVKFSDISLHNRVSEIGVIFLWSKKISSYFAVELISYLNDWKILLTITFSSTVPWVFCLFRLPWTFSLNTAKKNTLICHSVKEQVMYDFVRYGNFIRYHPDFCIRLLWMGHLMHYSIEESSTPVC